jgi:Rhodopirellula transposase DDE domain
MSSLKWTHKTTAKIAGQLRRLGIRVGARTVARLLDKLHFSLRVNCKKIAAGDRSSRDQQLLPDCDVASAVMAIPSSASMPRSANWWVTSRILAVSAPVGNPHLFLLRAAAGEVCRARGRSRAHSVERRQASRDMRHDGVLSALGATAELAGNGASVPDQLGSGVSVGGMVCAVGLGAPGTARDRIHRGWTRFIGDAACGQTTF